MQDIKTLILKGYQKFEFSLGDESVITKYLKYLETPDLEIRKQVELFHLELLESLISIQEHDIKSSNRYIKNLKSSENLRNFWGEKFEVIIHSKLIKLVDQNAISTVRRGKDGKEPDLLFDFENHQLGIELTTLKFEKSPNKLELASFKKMMDKISEKNNNVYANKNTVLFIDISNIEFLNALMTGNSSVDFLDKYKDQLEALSTKLNFKFILFLESIFYYDSMKNLKRCLNPIAGITDNEKPNSVNRFLNLAFNDFKKGDNKIYRHQNI
ncbi:hypothetical protein JKA74_00010 [Marivirga sp. S37H4]|uniref:Uncharacterized protein n=1 Tax=Marivirga aurantiaca TaxID=2802615 RepID=A0A935C7Z3_9BACT|nr:hypothetical protein [Marivirga aurantiaca]MBK6263398.1 hypothetical protein [Marivirga aurantiaca]